MLDTPIPSLPLSKVPDRYMAMADLMNRLVGESTTMQVLAHSLPAADFYFEDFYAKLFYNGRSDTKVEVRLKQLLRLRLSKLHGCALCNRANEEEVRGLGFTEPQIDTLFENDPQRDLFSDAEMAVIDFTDQMVLDNQQGSLNPALYARMHRYFSDE